ncbi:MAG: hypothetical protein N3F04_05610 [Candidatus Nezhaarchaeota archaeon]|nr:hypothetical protein [Candidatus Nezhaarchaeota archaeon]MCX8142218.1 hypothetical protein [Candidatus Nezhaarchaeota archaeon]MDW8050809.1 hypothetical protein [Nitrososphaerota archaeon]
MRLKAGSRVIICPKCGHEFDITYARTFACGTCPSAAIGCEQVKCPYCGHEWPV